MTFLDQHFSCGAKLTNQRIFSAAGAENRHILGQFLVFLGVEKCQKNPVFEKTGLKTPPTRATSKSNITQSNITLVGDKKKVQNLKNLCNFYVNLGSILSHFLCKKHLRPLTYTPTCQDQHYTYKIFFITSSSFFF